MKSLVLLVLLVLFAAACGNSTHSALDDPACLYERVDVDAGAVTYVVQGFATLSECRSYSRLCNAVPWPNGERARCTECCSSCGL